MNKRVSRLIAEAKEKGYTELDLSYNILKNIDINGLKDLINRANALKLISGGKDS